MSVGPFHVAFDRLADLVEGRLLPEARNRVQSHLAVCSECRAEIDWLERTISLMHDDGGEDAPSDVIARAVRRFRPSVPAERPSLKGRVIAALRFDSAQMTTAFGVRMVLPAPRQLLYNVGDYDLDIRITPDGSSHAVSGQVLGPIMGGSVFLRGAEGAVRSEINELQEFILPAVPPGDYTLLIDSGDISVEVSAITIGR